MIDVRNVCVIKSKKIILDNISVKLNHPRFHMIVGPNEFWQNSSTESYLCRRLR